MDPHMIEWPDPAPPMPRAANDPGVEACEHFVEAAQAVKSHLSGGHVGEKAPATAVYNAAVKGIEDVVHNAVNDTHRIMRSRSFFEVIEVQREAVERSTQIMMMHASALMNIWAMGPMANMDLSKVANSNNRMRTDGSALGEAANGNEDITGIAVA